MLRLHDLALDPASLDRMLTATEGWPAGLRLALLAGQGRTPDEWLRNVRGDHHAIAEYLTEEVLERQPAELQRFLLRTSILDRLSPDCATPLPGRPAADHLAKLARENLFVTALDDHDEWYRYHHLFAELLAALARRRAPDELPDLHRRAAAWHTEHSDNERAVRTGSQPATSQRLPGRPSWRASSSSNVVGSRVRAVCWIRSATSSCPSKRR